MAGPRTSLEHRPDPQDTLTFEQLLERFATHVDTRNAEHRNRALGGKTAQEVSAGDHTEIRRVRPSVLALILLRRAVFRTVQREGIELYGHWYHAAFLNKIGGCSVEVGWFGTDLSRIAVFERVPAAVDDEADTAPATGFLGWAKLSGTLSTREIEGLTGSRDRQVRTIEDAERAGDQLRLDTLPAGTCAEPLAPAPRRGRVRTAGTHQAAHSRVVARLADKQRHKSK